MNPIEIILVEDNMSDAELTIRALKKHNLANNLVHLKDGAEALDFIFGKGVYQGRNIDILPKVILLDIKMPKVDGITVLEKLKENEKTKLIPVVILTSSKEHPDIEKCYQIGASSYIVKPVEFESFYDAIKDLGFYWLILNNSCENSLKKVK
ncbi:MAG: response regulator [Chitinophagaceae bacterium]|nr:response regulator [Chitinophagaceae bacterium]